VLCGCSAKWSKAYEEIGNLSAVVLGKEWSSFLISRNESFLGYLRNIEGVWWLVLAGHTREETLASVLYLESTYFSDTPLEAYAVEYLRSEYKEHLIQVQVERRRLHGNYNRREVLSIEINEVPPPWLTYRFSLKAFLMKKYTIVTGYSLMEICEDHWVGEGGNPE